MCATVVDRRGSPLARSQAPRDQFVSQTNRIERSRAPVSAVILAFNEEHNLVPCLESLCGWVNNIIVVDSGSTDRTAEIARDYGAQMLVHPFETHNRQWQWALRNLPEGASEWILGLDADQRVTPELASETCETLESGAEGDFRLAVADVTQNETVHRRVFL